MGAMKRIIQTFSGFAYDATTRLIVERAPKMGADEVLVYDDLWLMDTPLYRDYGWLWNHPDNHGHMNRGFGWFAWKPFIMLDALSRCDPGNIVLFIDADTFPIHDFSMLYDECERIGGTMLFSAVGCFNRQWCKRDCFIRMGCDEPRFHDAQHAVARFYLFQKSAPGVDEFLNEWQRFCLDRHATTFDPSTLGPELPGFREHRCEQAILTNLAHKYGHKLYREACQFGAHVDEDKDLYPQLFEQVGTTTEKLLIGSKYRNVLPYGSLAATC